MISLEKELDRLGKKKIKVDDRPLNGLYEPLDEDINASDERIKNLMELANVHYNDALELVRDNNISKAMELLERSLEYNPEDKEILNLIGLCNYFLCNFDKAVLEWNKSIRASSVDNRAQYYLAYLKSKEFKSFMEYYNLAISYIDKFRYKDAIELLLEIIKTNSELVEPYSIIGNCYFALGEYSKAKEYFLEALDRDKENIKYLKYLNKINEYSTGNGKRDKDSNLKYKAIIASLALVIAIGSIAFYSNYTKKVDQLLAKEDSRLEEESDEEKSITKEPEAEEDIEDEGENQVEKTGHSEDLQASEEVPNFEGSEFDILKNSIDSFQDGNYSEAITSFTYLVENAESEDIVAEATYHLAVSLQLEGKLKEAGGYYNNYIGKYSDKTYYDDSLYNYGLMLYENGQEARAKEVLGKLREVEETIFMNSKVEKILNQ